MNYYLNAFNEMLRKRQENQMPKMKGGSGGGNERSPTAFDSMTNTQKAAYYSDNPTMAAITQFGQQALNYAPYGVGTLMKAQQSMFPDFSREQGMVNRGIDPGTGLQVGGYGSSQPPNLQSFDTPTPTPTGLYGDQFEGMPAPAKPNNFLASLLSGILPSSNVSLTPAPVENREATPVGFSSPTANFGKESSIPTAGVNSSAFLSRDQRIEQAARDATSRQSSAEGVAAANISGYGGGENSFGGGSRSFGEGQYAQGGMVRLKDLLGKAPGPDDGYGALQDGEFVIKRDAVKRYGVKMLENINGRKVAKKQLSQNNLNTFTK